MKMVVRPFFASARKAFCVGAEKNCVIAGAAAVLLLMAGCAGTKEYDAGGTFEATEVTVSAEASGRILDLGFEEGDEVEAGQVLGSIDSVQLHLQKLMLLRQRSSVRSGRPDAERQVAALRAQIARALQEKERIERLLQDGAVPARQLDDVSSQIEVLNSQLEASLSTLEGSAAAVDENSSAIDLQIAQVEDRLAKCRLTAPIGGKVLAKYAEAGELAAAGRPVLKIADMDRLFLRAYFTSDQLSGLQVGQEVRVIADFGGNEQYAYAGKVTWIASESEFTPKSIQTRNSRANLVYAVKIAVRNDGRLKIGLSGSVIL